MSYFAIAYQPEREKSRQMPFGVRGARLFNYQIERPTAAKKDSKLSLADRIEIEVVTLSKGTNFIDADKWNSVLKHEVNQIAIANLVKCGALTVHTPTAEFPVRDTTDFEDVGIIQELAENSKDVDWLSLSLNVDRRPEVRKLLADRLRDIQDEVAAMSQTISGSVASGR